MFFISSVFNRFFLQVASPASCFICSLRIFILHILIVNRANEEKEEYVVKSRQELYDLWENNCLTAKKIYDKAREYILETLLNYDLDALGFEEVEEVEDLVETETSNTIDPELENKVKIR